MKGLNYSAEVRTELDGQEDSIDNLFVHLFRDYDWSGRKITASRLMAPTNKQIKNIDITPGVSVLSVLSHLNYQPWFALAEFVDNSLQSYLANQEKISKVGDGSKRLSVSIEIETVDEGLIKIRDNAAGISRSDFPRAFRPAQLPPDRSGLSEFGMGMKSASCWFAPKWTVRTSALGEPVERSVSFDIDKIVKNDISELAVKSRKQKASVHFTEILLSSLHHVPVGRTLGKIKEHLRDIYRIFVRDDLLELRFNGELLEHQPPDVLVAPSYRNIEGKAKEWRHEFDFDFGDGLRAHGFAAIRKTGSTSGAGFALFRRNRLIQGSADMGYKPETIFGKPNSFASQRVFGEIHLEGFDVSHTKDGFRWDENEQPFLEFLKDELSSRKMPLLQQAREHRIERPPKDYRRGASKAAKRTSNSIRRHTPPVLDDIRTDNAAAKTPRKLNDLTSLATVRRFELELEGQKWCISLELSVDSSVGDWIEISDSPSRNGDVREIGLRMSLIHPFMQKFCGVECEDIEPLLRIATAIALAEISARDAGVKMAGAVRRNVNRLLRDALWQT